VLETVTPDVAADAEVVVEGGTTPVSDYDDETPSPEVAGEAPEGETLDENDRPVSEDIADEEETN
jgi:hypothetical protein